MAAPTAVAELRARYLSVGVDHVIVTQLVAATDRPVGVVIFASAVGYEAACSYRAEWTLAHKLAEQGFSSLRFDWPGTGDSIGPPLGGDTATRWCDTLRSVIRVAREQTPAVPVVVFATRFGATIAASVITDAPIDELIVWAPFASGKTYLREMHAFYRMHTRGIVAPSQPENPGDLPGLRLTPEGLNALKPLAVPRDHPRLPAVPRLLVVQRATTPLSEALVSDLQRLGRETTVVTTGDFEVMMTKPDESRIPHETFDLVTGWLAGRPPPATPTPATAAAAPAIGEPVTLSMAVSSGGVVEQPVTIQRGDERLFGVMTTPAEPVPGRPWVLMLSAGALPRSGPHGMYAAIARQAARAGIHSLRLDVCGIGESDGPGEVDGDLAALYDDARLEDVTAAIDYLTVTRSATSIVCLGLCAGAYHAFQAALATPRVRGAVMINPVFLFWAHRTSTRRELIHLRRSLLMPRKWGRLLRGEINLRRAFPAAIAGARSAVRALPGRVVDHQHTPVVSSRSAGRGDVRTAITSLAKRGVAVAFIFSESDPGLAYIEEHLGRQARGGGEAFDVVIIPGTDHSFTPHDARAECERSALATLTAVLADADVDARVAAATPRPRTRRIAAPSPVVVLGGSDNALSIARSLGRRGIPVSAINVAGADIRHSRYSTWIELAGNDPFETRLERFLCSRASDDLRGSVLLAASDEPLEVLARNRAALQDKFLLDISNPPAQIAMLDKVTTYQAGRAAGVPLPGFWEVDAASDLEALRDAITFPVLVKPRLSHHGAAAFGSKYFRVDRFDDLKRQVGDVQAMGVACFLVERIPGPDSLLCSYYTYLDADGNPEFDFTKRIIRRAPPEMGLASYHITDHVLGVKDLALRLFQHVALVGVANVEFKLDPRDQTLKLIECNARFTAANCLLDACGYDLAYHVYARIVGREPPILGDYPDGVRLWDPVRDLRAFQELRQRGEITTATWLRSITHRQTTPFLARDDRRPAAARLLRQVTAQIAAR
jgi:D-aspartate ligase